MSLCRHLEQMGFTGRRLKGMPAFSLQAASVVPPIICEKQAPMGRLREGEHSDVQSSSSFHYCVFPGHTGLVVFPWGPPLCSKKSLHLCPPALPWFGLQRPL